MNCKQKVMAKKRTKTKTLKMNKNLWIAVVGSHKKQLQVLNDAVGIEIV